LRCDFFGAADDPVKLEVPDLRGAPFAAPVFGRGADLPKLGIVLVASSFIWHAQARKSTNNALFRCCVCLCGLVELR
jgi:hypothetical protein